MSVLAYPEARAALAAAWRAGRLDHRRYAVALDEFADLMTEVVIVGIDDRLARRAGDLAADLGLRGYDSVHLATALALEGADTVMVTWDRDLAQAATAAGMAVSPA